MIREARPDERARVGELRVTAYRDLGMLSEGDRYAQTLRTLGFDGPSTVLVATDDDQAGGPGGTVILGTITVEPFGPHSELARDEGEADIRAFAVDPRAQGRGVGRALLQAVVADAAKGGLRRLRLCTQPAMTTAQRLYAGAGFARTPDLDFEPVPGLILRAYVLALD
jgi:ribosomal protein S18 acetylase RimI-like enzyme